ncbi:MAG: sensor histidine kinase [Chlorobi bacterium CHB2]|nr:sensor histidine kinase [Chlorobi bacterium CHB2]
MFTTLRSKINAGFFAIIALNVVFGVWSVFRFAHIGEYTDRMLTPNYEAAATAIELMQLVDDQQRLLQSVPTTWPQTKAQKNWQDEFRNRNAQLIAIVYESRIDTLLGYAEALLRIRSATQEYNRATQRLLSGQDSIFSIASMDVVFRAVGQLRRESRSMLTIARKQVAESRGKVQEETQKTLYAIIVSVMISVVAAILAGIFYSRWATRPIQRLNQAVKNLSGGKLGERVLITTDDEFGDLTFEFNRMIERLRKYEELNYDQLLIEKQKVEAVVSSIGVPVVVVNAEAEILLLNNAAVDLFRVENPAQKVGALLEQIIPDQQLQQYIRGKLLIPELSNPAMETAGELPVYIRQVEGAEHYYAVQVLPLVATLSVQGVVVLFSDITHFKELDRIKSDFLARVSHELRTPLSSILMTADILQEEITGDLNEQQLDLVKGVKEDCVRLTKLVSDLLEISRLEKRNTPKQSTWVNLPKILAMIQQQHRVQLQEKGVVLKISTEQANPEVWINQDDLLLMLNNLVSNAIRHTPSGGEVSITAYSRNSDVIIEVSDTGSGIPRDSMDKIFLKFYQVESSGQNNPGSVGLGLAIVREIISIYHGSVLAVSELGKGSTFTLRIPQQFGSGQQYHNNIGPSNERASG